MKAALVSNLVTRDITANQRHMLELSGKAAKAGAKLIIFPEAAATGLADTGEVEHDLGIAEPIPGPRNSEWREFAKAEGVWFTAGLLERDGEKIYDSAVLFDPGGELILHYRRIDPHWRNPADDPAIYCVGEDVFVVDTSIGKLGLLICGDLWDDAILERLKEKRPDYLLYPFLRSIEKGRDLRTEWQKELGGYRERWAMTGAAVLAVNLFEGNSADSSIGGAWCVDRDGELIASLPILSEGILLVDLDTLLP